jgi:hypothetical protein
MENIKNRKFALHNGLGLPGGLHQTTLKLNGIQIIRFNSISATAVVRLPAGPLVDANAVPAVWKFLIIRLIWNSC